MYHSSTCSSVCVGVWLDFHKQVSDTAKAPNKGCRMSSFSQNTSHHMTLISFSTIKGSMNDTESMSVLESASSRLHKACEAQQSLLELNIVLREFPRAMKFKTYGNLPVHTACLNQAGLETLKALVEADPMSVFERDDHGNNPLHLAAFSGSPSSSIKFLVHQSPMSILELNHNGQTPLDRAKDPFFGTQSIAIIEWLENPFFLEEEESRFQVNFAMSTTGDDPTVRSSMTEDTFLLPKRLYYQEGIQVNVIVILAPMK